MEALDWIDRVAKLAPLLTGVAALVGAAIAVLGYRKWHAETVGKRKLELAEEILADFYQVREIFAFVRTPFQPVGAGKTRVPTGPETEEEKDLRNFYFTPIERLSAKSEFLGQFEARKYRAMAYFGSEAVKPFDQFRDIHTRITGAATQLINSVGKSGIDPSFSKGWRMVLGMTSPTEDKFKHQIDEMIDAAERLFKPVLLRAK